MFGGFTSFYCDSYRSDDFIIIMKEPEPELTDELYLAMNEITNDIKRGGGEDIEYQIAVCSESAYDILTGLEIFNGKADEKSAYHSNPTSPYDIGHADSLYFSEDCNGQLSFFEGKKNLNNGDFKDHKRFFEEFSKCYRLNDYKVFLWIRGGSDKALSDINMTTTF